MSNDRTLPAIVYGFAPTPEYLWHKSRKYQTNADYTGDECRNKFDHRRDTPQSRLAKRWLELDKPVHHAPELLSGHDRAIAQPKPRIVPQEPIQIPKGATAIYCVKTGQHVGQMLTTYEYPPHAVHPDWIVTDGINLDNLMGYDARAYVAFCLGKIDVFWRQKQHRSNSTIRYMTKIDALEHHWSLVKAYDDLGQVSDIHLQELANALCRFCTYAPLSYRVLDDKLLVGQRQADQLAACAVNGVLLQSLERATVRTLATAEQFQTAIKTPKFEERPSSIEDAARGPSNIRSQQKSKDYQKNARTNKLMADLLREFGGVMGWANVAPKRPQNQAQSLLSRLSRNVSAVDRNTARAEPTDDFERDMLDELNKLMGESSSYVMSDDDEDDTVEVRTIPRALVESLAEPTQPIAAAKPVVSSTQSLLNRIRRN